MPVDGYRQESVFQHNLNRRGAGLWMARNDRGFTIPDGVASDIVILSKQGREVLLIERKNDPTGFALPGGFLDPNETLLECAVRELREETSLTVSKEQLTLVGVYSDPNRDPRARIISVAYVCSVEDEVLNRAASGDDAKGLKVVAVADILQDKVRTVFDHKQIITEAVKMVL